jgi:hypothetical protein
MITRSSKLDALIRNLRRCGLLVEKSCSDFWRLTAKRPMKKRKGRLWQQMTR